MANLAVALRCPREVGVDHDEGKVAAELHGRVGGSDEDARWGLDLCGGRISDISSRLSET